MTPFKVCIEAMTVAAADYTITAADESEARSEALRRAAAHDWAFDQPDSFRVIEVDGREVDGDYLSAAQVRGEEPVPEDSYERRVDALTKESLVRLIEVTELFADTAPDDVQTEIALAIGHLKARFGLTR
ncbi:hypothetical protein [Azospirillum argentinense]|uniref:hypothetical protein n=1 Tax=Azospirillum argentinense TaxID=2970906 RepID=UPI0032DEFF0D